MLRTVILITRGILLDRRSRRWTMFITLGGAMLMCFAGTTFLSGEIPMPWGFFIYWGICAWLTLAALLLALWDMLLLRIEARKARRDLRNEFLNEDHRES